MVSLPSVSGFVIFNLAQDVHNTSALAVMYAERQKLFLKVFFVKTIFVVVRIRQGK